MKISMSREEWGIFLLRMNMAGVFLWFGFSQLIDGINWVYLVPAWASELLHIPPAMIVLANGAFEVFAGTLLATGFLVRPVALLLALHLAGIAASIGFNATGIRDAGLTMATFALFLLYKQHKTPVVETEQEEISI